MTFPLLDRDLETDLLIIGGGFTGCSAALKAAELDMSVCLLEARTIGYGGSGRNVGLVNAGLWLSPEQIKSSMGVEAGQTLNRLLSEAPARVFDLIKKHQINCEATRKGTLYCAPSKAGLAKLKDRYRQLTSDGAPVVLCDADETRQRTGTNRYMGALHDARAGTIQPLAYCKGLARAAWWHGAQVMEDSPVTGLSHDGGYWHARTASGSVRARHLILATNAYHQQITGMPAPESITVNYFQVATHPLSDAHRQVILPGLEGCWDTAMVMSSFRLDGLGRLIVGGMGSLDQAGARIHKAWAARKIASLFPQLPAPEIQFAWCGQIAMTSDHTPRIVSCGPNAYAVFGYSGRGIGPGTTFGTLLAEAIATGQMDGLPVPLTTDHSESLAGLKAILYETGAAVTHFSSLR